MGSNSVTSILCEETEPQGNWLPQDGELVSDRAGIGTQTFSLSILSALPVLG